MSLNTTYKVSFKHAVENLVRNGGKVNGDMVEIPVQIPKAVKLEQGFEGHYPLTKTPLKWSANKDEFSFDFDGIGFMVRGETSKSDDESAYVFNADLYIDGKMVEQIKLPVSFTTRRFDICWKYQMPKGKHTVRLKITNPAKENGLRAYDAIIYTDQPVDGLQWNLSAAKN
jgi:hypothetical protein